MSSVGSSVSHWWGVALEPQGMGCRCPRLQALSHPRAWTPTGHSTSPHFLSWGDSLQTPTPRPPGPCSDTGLGTPRNKSPNAPSAHPTGAWSPASAYRPRLPGLQWCPKAESGGGRWGEASFFQASLISLVPLQPKHSCVASSRGSPWLPWRQQPPQGCLQTSGPSWTDGWSSSQSRVGPTWLHVTGGASRPCPAG